MITSTFFRLWFSKNLQFWLYPNWLIYLFIAVFAFSSPFCYAKTAFSYSRALWSPCTPVLFMVKDVVKSQPEMIDMWSWFWGGRSAWKTLLRQRRNLQRAKNKHTNRHMWSTIRKEMINMWSDKIDQQRAENYLVLLLQMLYCNLELHDCQGPLRIKINAQNLIRSKQRKKFFKGCWQSCIYMV